MKKTRLMMILAAVAALSTAPVFAASAGGARGARTQTRQYLRDGSGAGQQQKLQKQLRLRDGSCGAYEQCICDGTGKGLGRGKGGGQGKGGGPRDGSCQNIN